MLLADAPLCGVAAAAAGVVAPLVGVALTACLAALLGVGAVVAVVVFTADRAVGVSVTPPALLAAAGFAGVDSAGSAVRAGVGERGAAGDWGSPSSFRRSSLDGWMKRPCPGSHVK